MKNYFKLIISIIICQSAGLISSLFMGSVDGWYQGLIQPSFSPPSWVFGPAWILFYTLMGIALYLIWVKKGFSVLFAVHLIFNALWSVLFFGLKNPLSALIDLVIIWAFILILIINFYKIKKLAAWLLVPYFLWVSFAGVLNYFIWLLN